jgi:preprotein translocase subunit SecG
MTIAIDIMLVLWIAVALLMILVILMQRPKSEGLGAAFGGGVTENIFGAQTTTVLTKITGWLAGTFFVLTFLLSVLYAHRGMGESTLSRELKKGAAAPVGAPATGASVSPIASPNAPGAAVPAPGAPVVAPVTGGPAPPGPAAPAGSAKPSDLAVGAVPTSNAPVINPPAAPAPSGSASPRRP